MAATDPLALRAGASGRMVWLDIVRGAALFGIAQINFPSFVAGAMPLSVLYGSDSSAASRISYALLTFFVSAKFYPIFAFLFGYGHALQRRSLRAGGLDVDAILRRRYACLLLFGVVHGTLLFFGDILTIYALCGLLLLALPVTDQKRAGQSMRFWAALSVLVIGVGFFADPQTSTDSHARWVSTHQIELDLIAQGQLWPVLAGRIETYATALASQVFSFIPQLLMFMCAGIWCADAGVAADPARHRKLFMRALMVGIVLGGPINLALVLVDLRLIDAIPVQLGLADALDNLAFVQSLAYLGALGLYASRVREDELAAPWRWLAATGRFALTNYVTQSMVMCVIWYGGARRFAPASTALSMAAWALGVSLFQVVLSSQAVKRVQQGPLERIWRQVTYRAPLPRG